jgi:flavocytochrome c
MNTSRRNLLLGTAAAVASAPLMAAEKSGERPGMPAKWDETYDVVIIGSGFAGLAAAIEAKMAGANVIVLEKMRTAGGNSIINGGILSAPGCPQQKMHGIKDSPELLAKDMLTAGAHLNYPDKVKYIADHALENFNWCVDTLHVNFNPTAIGQEGGHSVPRYVRTYNGSGSAIVSQELAKLKELGVEVRLRTYVEHILRDPKTGRVEGVAVRQGYRFPDATSGKPKTIRARKGVCLCYGGFAADAAFRTMYDPRLTADFQTTNQPGATSELWRETAAIGCAQIQQDWIQCGPWCNPKEKGMGMAVVFNQSGGAEFGVWVDSTGRRFVNELANRKVRADAIFALHDKGMKAYAICDQNGVDHVTSLQKNCVSYLMSIGAVEKFDTLEALAKKYKMDPKVLQATIDEVNAAVKSGKDEHFGRYMNKEFKPMATAPWYICESTPKVHHCMGGLVTTPEGRVVDIRTSKPIPGLWAAGEATGGVHGAVRLGSCATLDCLVMGRSIGRGVAKEA